jgi:flavin reductase (DIM6/NTAB) family NADH-FMN oxidoreductase RutF
MKSETPALSVQDEFKGAMRRLASTVAIVSAARDEDRYGMTITAVTSYSMTPPTLVVCINRSASLHPLLAGAESALFCVNLLGEGHEDVANVFAGKLPREERFAMGEWGQDDSGIPYLRDAQCNLFCRVHSALTVFSHTLFVGTVETVRVHGESRPLIYGNGCYATLQP